MTLEFEPEFLRSCTQLWGITGEEVERAVEEADEVVERFIGPPEQPKAISIHLYIAHEMEGRESSRVLVLTVTAAGVERVEDAWPIPYSVIARQKGAVELLKAVTDRFGYDTWVGQAGPRKLFLAEFVPGPEPGQAPVRSAALSGRAGMLSQNMRGLEDGRIAVFYAFTLDVTSFSAALSGKAT